MRTTLQQSLVTACSLVLTLLIPPPSVFGQGSLTPPAAPTPTMKSLDQVEPRTIVNATNTPGDANNTFIISAPGSYYFTGNITGASGKHGISIQANDVTLDLNGFALIAGGGGAFRGVNVPNAQSNLSVRNGSVRGWTDGGVRADAAVMLAEKLRLTSNVGATGLVAGNGALVRDCVASSNATGFAGGDRAQFSNCISTVNSGAGFNCTSYVTIVDCTSSRNGTDGIVVGSSSNVIRCNSSRNVPLGGSTGGSGIIAGAGCTIADCTAGSNQVSGIFAGNGSTIQRCTAQANVGGGIGGNLNCHIIGNTADGNGFVGISVGGGCRVEGNSCTANTNSGFFVVVGTRDLIIGNSAHGNNPNFSLNSTTVRGPVVDMTSDTDIITTSAWANFSY